MCKVRQKDGSVTMKLGVRSRTTLRMQTVRDIEAKARVAANNGWSYIYYGVGDADGSVVSALLFECGCLSLHICTLITI